MDILGCILGFLTLIILVYKNVSIYIAAFISSAIVVIFNGLPLIESMTVTYMQKFGIFVTGYYFILLFGSIQARLFSESGAALSIADTLTNLFIKDGYSEKKRQILGMLVIIILATILCFGGIIAGVDLVLLYPIALVIFEKVNIPKRFILGVMAGGAYTFGITAPGSPQVTNMVAMTVLGTPADSALIPGIIGSIAELVTVLLLLNYLITKAKNRGENFAYHPDDKVYDKDNKRPGFIAAISPLILLWILFNIFKVHIAICLIVSIILSLVLFWRFLEGKNILELVNSGAASGVPMVMTVSAVVGFGGVVSTTEAFQSILNSILNLSLPPLLLLIFCVAIMCALTGGSSTGQLIVLPLIKDKLLAMGLKATAIHRVSVFSSTMLDTLPYCGSILMLLPLTKMKLSEIYPPMFISTIICTSIGTAVVTILIALFPGLS